MSNVNHYHYTEEQLELLAKMIDEFFDPEADDFLYAMRDFIKENRGDSFKCIIDTVGIYIHLMTREEAVEKITPIIDAELSELYDYLDEHKVYKSIIARWRLSMGL